MLRKLGDYCCLLILPQEAIVDQDARKLRPNRLIEECRRHCRIDATGQAADHAAAANLLPHSSNCLPGEVAELPGSRAAANRREKVVQHVAAQRRMSDLGMELHAKDGE